MELRGGTGGMSTRRVVLELLSDGLAALAARAAFVRPGDVKSVGDLSYNPSATIEPGLEAPTNATAIASPVPT